MLRQHLWIGALAVGLVCGCERKERSVDISPSRPAEPTPNEPMRDKRIEPDIQRGELAPAAAVQAIAEARCSREARCNNIGADHKYQTVAECKSKISADRSENLNVWDCPRGIDKKELDECMEAIGKEDCNNPLDSLSRVAACRSSDLCLSTK